ncbi:MAG: DUF2339 domain-containing protein, partial [Spirochaeta sp.]
LLLSAPPDITGTTILIAHTAAVLALLSWSRLLPSRNSGLAALRFALAACILALTLEIPAGFRDITVSAVALLYYTVATAANTETGFVPQLRTRTRNWLRTLAAHSYWFYASGLILFVLHRLDTPAPPDIRITALAVFISSLYPVTAITLKGFGADTPWRRHTERFRGRWLLLPLFAALGLGFVFELNGPGLTAILLVESLLIFSAGIFTRDRIFRPAAYALLLAGLARMLLIDLARSDTLSRAVIFILAGLCLLGINWLYNRWGPKT